MTFPSIDVAFTAYLPILELECDLSTLELSTVTVCSFNVCTTNLVFSLTHTLKCPRYKRGAATLQCTGHSQS